MVRKNIPSAFCDTKFGGSPLKIKMPKDQTFALLFSYPNGELAALNALRALLPGAAQVRGTLVYKDNVLKLEKNPLQGDDGEHDLQISAFPLLGPDVTHQRAVLQEVLKSLSSLAGEVDVLAEDELR